MTPTLRPALFAGALIGAFVLSSCASMGYQRAAAVPERPTARPETPERPTERPETPERPIPEIPLRIMGTGQVAPGTLSSFLLSVNPGAGEDFSADLAR
ncbi:MAG: hypothetical protein LBO76_04885, partial [Treponema sp.]|nr:hypothetical protein [Treponema sp.]